MIDNELLAICYNVEHMGESLSSVAAALNNTLYKDIIDWYLKYTGDSKEDKCIQCASLLYFLYLHDNIDFANVEQFSKFCDILCERYGVRRNDVFSLLADYRKLLNT